MSNVFFNPYNHQGEQNLIESLIVESISIYGHGVFYCPRTLVKKDDVYGEDSLSTYNQTFEFDVYIRSYDSYEGDGTFLSKFNLEIRDQITFVAARRMFESEITQMQSEITRPREGDLIYSSMMKRLFIIKYVNNTSIFYQLGALQVWDIVCEVFEYSNERFSTGIAEIDAIEDKYTVSNVFSNTEYQDAMSDVFETNIEFQEEGAPLIDWSETDPFSSGSL